MDNTPTSPRLEILPEMVDGVLLVDKESGPTSHDVVDRIRRRFRFYKVGHGGTLDPQATGLLVILIGRGTKLSNRLIASDKRYEGTIRLGIATDTQDAQGKVLQERDAAGVTREQLTEAMGRFAGDVLQTPPMVSAVKVDGVPLYKLARRGETVERKPKLVHVYEFRLVDFASPRGRFMLRCTKGTYVRTLCADVGEALGCGAHLEQLRRTRSGDLRLEDAVPMAEVLRMNLEEICRRIIPIGKVPLGPSPDVERGRG
jgi:tRNA pseudouridine55 synthase